MLIWIGWLGRAAAQEPGAEEALVYNADQVLVTTFQAENTASEADAGRLFELFRTRFALTNDVVSMDAVPRFEPQGYDGPEYVHGCPPGQYAGCMLVLGQRVSADRAVGATVRREADEFDATRSVVVLTIHIVDVAESREVASFGVPVSSEREQQTIDGIARVFDDVVRGDYELQDQREKGLAPDELALAEAREERMGGMLVALEAELGAAIRSVEVGRIDPPKVTREDLVERAEYEELPPWDQVGMSQDEYLRFANSGQDLETWREEGWGRFGRVLARFSAGGGNGPWHESYVAEALRSDQDLQVVQTVQFLEVVNAPSGIFEAELGFGVAPFADVVFATTARTGQTSYTEDEDVQGQVPVPGREQRIAMTTWQFSGRVNLAPFPRWPVRPTVAVGLGRWSGKGIPATTRFERFAPPAGTFLELIPGVEVDASPTVALSLRLHETLPIAGTFVRRTETGEPLMEDPPGPTNNRGPGIGIQAGLLVRLGPLFHPPERERTMFEDDEP